MYNCSHCMFLLNNVDTDEDVAKNASATSNQADRGNLYASRGVNQPQPEAPLSDGSNMDLRKSQPGVQKETYAPVKSQQPYKMTSVYVLCLFYVVVCFNCLSLPPTRASMSSIEHFNIPEYTEDEPNNNTKPAEFAMVKREEQRAQRSAAPVPSGDAFRANAQAQGPQFAAQPVEIPQQEGANQGPPMEMVSTQATHMTNRNEGSNGGSIPARSLEQPAGGGQGEYQTPVDTYQRQQEIAMMANFGSQQHSQAYGMQSMPQIYSSASNAASYQQPHQPYDLYSSQNSMPQYALQPQPGSAGADLLGQ